jgi:hypothetical protein
VNEEVEKRRMVRMHSARSNVFFLLKLLLVLYVTIGIATRSFGLIINKINSLKSERE